jgi:hypothetical protein
MLSYEDCLGLCELTEDEIRAIAEHEHLAEIAALELGQYLMEMPDGDLVIRRMILDDIQAAEGRNDLHRTLALKATLRHFIETHPRHAGKA